MARAFGVALENRRVVVVVLHLGLIALSNYLALWLRFDGVVPPDLAAQARALLPLLLLVRVVTFLPFRLYEGLWRYTSIRDARNIVAAVATSSAVFYLVVRLTFGANVYPRSVYIMDAVLLIVPRWAASGRSGAWRANWVAAPPAEGSSSSAPATRAR